MGEHHDGGVALWDVAHSGRSIQAWLHVPEGEVNTVAFSPDGQSLAASYGLRDSGVVMWDLSTRKRLMKGLLPVGKGIADRVAFSGDGKILAAAHAGNSVVGVVLWDATSLALDAAHPAGTVRLGEAGRLQPGLQDPCHRLPLRAWPPARWRGPAVGPGRRKRSTLMFTRLSTVMIAVAVTLSGGSPPRLSGMVEPNPPADAPVQLDFTMTVETQREPRCSPRRKRDRTLQCGLSAPVALPKGKP